MNNMDILTLLTTRRSSKKLTAPAPDELQMDSILQAATQVPDHGNLTPWRFVVMASEEGMGRYRQLLRDTVTQNQMGEEAMAKAERLGNMAPMVVAVIASPKSGKPEWEQELSAGCSAYAIQLAAKAQGFDSVWLTGMWVHSPLLKQAFACGEKEKIIGLVLLGTAECEPSAAKNTDVSAFTQVW